MKTEVQMLCLLKLKHNFKKMALDTVSWYYMHISLINKSLKKDKFDVIKEKKTSYSSSAGGGSASSPINIQRRNSPAGGGIHIRWLKSTAEEQLWRSLRVFYRMNTGQWRGLSCCQIRDTDSMDEKPPSCVKCRPAWVCLLRPTGLLTWSRGTLKLWRWCTGRTRWVDTLSISVCSYRAFGGFIVIFRVSGLKSPLHKLKP